MDTLKPYQEMMSQLLADNAINTRLLLQVDKTRIYEVRLSTGCLKNTEDVHYSHRLSIVGLMKPIALIAKP